MAAATTPADQHMGAAACHRPSGPGRRIDEHARAIGDQWLPAYLAGRHSPYEPPQWMAIARAELNRRGHAIRWCTPNCRHHPWPPRTNPQQPTGVTPARERGRGSAARGGPAHGSGG